MKCFKYLLLNKCEITHSGYDNTLKYSIAGGNQEIINIIKENGYNEFKECLETSVKYHRYELTTWLNENYKCVPVYLPDCIECYNIDAFFYFLQHVHSLDEKDVLGRPCLHLASYIGSIPIAQYLIENGSNVDVVDYDDRIPLHIACENDHLPIVQYLVENGANVLAEDVFNMTPISWSFGKIDIIKYLVSKGAKQKKSCSLG